jgi:Uma2 family endonuclease
VDPEDPRAPPSEIWLALTPEERRRVVDSLPAEWDAMPPPEGDRHWNPKVSARKTLERWFSRLGRRVYVGSELAIYYPGERVFAPDVMAVLDVELRERDRWVVDAEGRGLDWTLEIFVGGDRKKDHEGNVERYARLGIPEYFLFDRGRARLSGWRLPTPNARSYEPIVPQRGRWVSSVLGLELCVVGERLRFMHGDAELPDAEELIDRLERIVDALQFRAEEEARRAEEEARRAEEEARRAEEEARRAEEEARRAQHLEGKLAAALEELEKLRRR